MGSAHSNKSFHALILRTIIENNKWQLLYSLFSTLFCQGFLQCGCYHLFGFCLNLFLATFSKETWKQFSLLNLSCDQKVSTLLSLLKLWILGLPRNTRSLLVPDPWQTSPRIVPNLPASIETPIFTKAKMSCSRKIILSNTVSINNFRPLESLKQTIPRVINDSTQLTYLQLSLSFSRLWLLFLPALINIKQNDYRNCDYKWTKWGKETIVYFQNIICNTHLYMIWSWLSMYM